MEEKPKIDLREEFEKNTLFGRIILRTPAAADKLYETTDPHDVTVQLFVNGIEFPAMEVFHQLESELKAQVGEYIEREAKNMLEERIAVQMGTFYDIMSDECEEFKKKMLEKLGIDIE